MTIVSILLAILLLGILIIAHEWGHFVASRAVGIGVQEFSIGFGPRLCGWTSKKHETKFSLRLILLGGYCAFYGEDDAEGKTVDDPRAYNRQPVWKRMISVLAGPLMNFVLAFVVTTLFFWFGGVTAISAYHPYIAVVNADSPAEQAGLQAGDVIAEINGINMQDGTTDTLLDTIGGWQDGDAPLQMTVQRGDTTFETAVTPVYSAGDGRALMGVSVSATYDTEKVSCSLGTAVTESFDTCVYAGGVILNSLKNLVTKGEGLDQTSGPVGVITMVSQQVQAGGFDAFINLLVVISINLGLFNLLPIPGLDGSRFLFMVLEAVRRKPVPPQKEAMVHLGGYVLLFGIMIFFTYRDILRLFR